MSLKFKLDDSIEYAVHIAEIIDRLQAKRAEHENRQQTDGDPDSEEE